MGFISWQIWLLAQFRLEKNFLSADLCAVIFLRNNKQKEKENTMQECTTAKAPSANCGSVCNKMAQDGWALVCATEVSECSGTKSVLMFFVRQKASS